MTSTTQNETTSIEQTIREALNNAGYGSYISYARPVVEALVAREKRIASSLIDYAIDNDASEEEVRTYISETGMAVPDLVADQDENTEDDSDTGALGRIEQALTNLTGRIDSLTQFARSNGYRG